MPRSARRPLAQRTAAGGTSRPATSRPATSRRATSAGSALEDASAARPPAVRLPEADAQLATLVTEPPEGDPWIYEIKYDGYRALAYLEDGSARLVSRNGLSFTERFAPICRALAELPVRDAIFDGEVCSLDARGRTSFEALQGVLRDRSAHDLVYFVFDVLWLDGEDLRALPLTERKRRLERVLPSTGSGVVRRAEHVRGDGAAFLHAARQLGLEGLIAKRGDRSYRAGRSLDWQKVKVERREELLIVGWTPPKGSRQRFGALLLGIPEPTSGGVRYAGKVGTGFDTRTLEDLHERMMPLRAEGATVLDPPREKGAVWIRPELVAEVRFTEWTQDGKLRHPTFLGLREDKSARDVRREVPASTRNR